VTFKGRFLFKVIEICVVEVLILLDVIRIVLSGCSKLLSSQEELSLRVLDVQNGIHIQSGFVSCRPTDQIESIVLDPASGLEDLLGGDPTAVFFQLTFLTDG